MAADYGVRARHRGPPVGKIAWIIVVVGVLVVGAATGYAWIQHQKEMVALAKVWIVAGPPCPSLSRPAFQAASVKATLGFDYDDVHFARAFGHVSCNEIGYDGGRSLSTYPVCEFTSPAVLQITTSKGEFYFAPQTGPATVAVEHGVPTCVMNSNFTARRDLT